MADRLFIATLRATLSADGEETIEYDVGQGNVFTVHRIYQRSTGAFDILDIADNFGNRYTNASANEPIGGQIFTDIDADNNNPASLANPIVIKNNGRLQIRVKDTSSSGNTVDIYLEGFLTN